MASDDLEDEIFSGSLDHEEGSNELLNTAGIVMALDNSVEEIPDSSLTRDHDERSHESSSTITINNFGNIVFELGNTIASNTSSSRIQVSGNGIVSIYAMV